MMTMDMNRQHGESATEAHRQLKEAPAAEQYPVTVETTFAALALQTCICLAANPPTRDGWVGWMIPKHGRLEMPPGKVDGMKRLRW